MANELEVKGTSGLSVWSGQIQEDFLRELWGKAGYKRFNEMRLNAPVIGGMLLAIEQAIHAARWTVTGDGDDDNRVQIVNDALDGMSVTWHDHISECLTMLPFGYSLFEIVWKYDASKALTWDKFAFRGQDTVYKWDLDDKTNDLKGFWQAAGITSVYLPAAKLLHYTARKEKNNPEGRSILRASWTSYYYWKNISVLEGIGVERDLAGLPMIGLPEGAATDTASTSDASKAAKLVRNVRNDEQAGIVLPFGWTFSLVSTGGSRQFDTSAIIQRYESRMLMSCLAQFLMLGQDKVGALSLSKDQTDFFNMACNSVADAIAETFTQQAIVPLLTMRGLDPDGVKMTHTPVGDIDLPGLADFLQKVGSMITWLPEDEAWLRGVGKLPTVDADRISEERLEKQRQAVEIMRMRSRQQPDEQRSDDSEEGQDDENRDDMSAEFYAANGAPDDKVERAAWEGRWKRLQRAFFRDQYNRVLKGAKGIE